MISINIYEITLQIINLIILLWLSNKLLAKPLSNFLKARKAKIENDLNTAKEAKEEAEKQAEEQAQVLKKAHIEAKEIREKAQKASLVEKEQAKLAAKAETERLIENSKKELAQETERVKQSLAAYSVDLSIKLTEKLVDKHIDEKSNKALIDSYLKETVSTS